MYIPPAYQPPSPEIAVAVMTRFPFATLITVDGTRPVATHIPLHLEPAAGPHGTLIGHVARANPHGALLSSRTESLAIFHGPHAYVSPTWYRDHPAVPTWHHVTVHAYGVARVIADRGELSAHMNRLIAQFESGPGAWSAQQAPPDFLDRMMAGITLFELPIARLETQCKLGQKRSVEDRTQVIEALQRSGRPEDAAVAAWMVSLPSVPPEFPITP